MPFTVHVTAEFGVPETVAVKFALCPGARVADVGDTDTVTGAPPPIETIAVALCVPAVASIATELGEGTAAGAVYVAVFAPVDAMVPTLELPPDTPFTSQAITVPGATQRDAVNAWDILAATLADAGEMEFAAAHEIVTVAAAVFDGSATLVAITETNPCGGVIAGAVYTAAFAPLTLMVPTPALPPPALFTAQLTPELALPAPLTVAVRLTLPPGITFAELGAMLTVKPF